ncbi:serine/threonine-protein kinase [Aggregatilinea lenta]|uniref:serine/threonine-protein kinase n=1 Tax=Aggregatilinea lenta TaxID=913108 RepID=UPI000E5BAA02|nr:serine/threonine-protein kinase [Aggregatilinea lenta]
MPPAHGDPLPESIGPYTVLDRIGAGGMASIYRATHRDDGREVALKVLAVHLAANTATRRRFEREASTLLRLQHPHILPVYDIGETDGTPYFAMRLLSGRTLDDRLHEGTLTADEAANILSQLASALDFAHEQGIIHRDVKPGNILVDDEGTLYLADFGVARLMGGDAHTSMTGDFIGTATYASPEQCRSETITPASDLYSLGVLTFQMLAGAPPFSGANIIALIKQHLDAPVPDPCAYNPELPPDAGSVLAKALAKQPEDRYSTAAAFSQAMDRALGRVERPDGIDDANWLFEGHPVPPAPPLEPDREPDGPEPDVNHAIDADADTDGPPDMRVLGTRPLAGHGPGWLRLGVYASLVVSVIGLVVAAAILTVRVLDDGPALGGITHDAALGVTVHYPAAWHVATTRADLLFAPRGPSLILSDRSVPPEGPYDAATLVIVVQRLDPASVFGVPAACRSEIAQGPREAFDCARARGAIVPTYDRFETPAGRGIRLSGTLPPTRATYPIVLLSTGQDDAWLAVIVVHWNGYPGARNLLDRIARSIELAS